MINDAIAHVQANTTVNFVSRTSQANYVRFVPGGTGTGRYADFLGMKGGSQIINLEVGLFGRGNVIHEIGHVLGLYHEQCRTDRASWILVHTANMAPQLPEVFYQFQTYTEMMQPGAQIGEFDFNSIMLYGSFDFSNGNPTMTRLDGSTWDGQRIGLSVGDIETIAIMYGAPYVKLRSVLLSSWQDPSGSFSDEREWFIDLYSDEACTIPFITQIVRDVAVKVEPFVANSSYSYTPGLPYTTIFTIPNGQQSASLGTFTAYENSFQGYIYSGEYYTFRVLSGFGRL
jgi:hypothetical protein